MEQLMQYKILIPLTLILGFAPFFPKPHIVEKIQMLIEGTLTKPIDIFDLVWHAWPFALLGYKLVKDFVIK